jgi:hypothetical protein
MSESNTEATPPQNIPADQAEAVQDAVNVDDGGAVEEDEARPVGDE